MKPEKQANPPATCPACGEAGPAEITHCEWCGAEYPVPDEGPDADVPRAATPAAH